MSSSKIAITLNSEVLLEVDALVKILLSCLSIVVLEYLMKECASLYVVYILRANL